MSLQKGHCKKEERHTRGYSVRIKFAVRFATDRSWRAVILRSVGAACINKERGQKISFLDTRGACASRNGCCYIEFKEQKKSDKMTLVFVLTNEYNINTRR